MQVVIVDEKEMIRNEAEVIERCEADARIERIPYSGEVIEYIREYPTDVLFANVNEVEQNTFEWIRQIQKTSPSCNIILITDNRDWFVEAEELHISGCILRPLTEEKVKRELNNLRFPIKQKRRGLYARCFGNFEVFFNGRPLSFRYQKTKEMFAYLIDRRGAMVTRDELITVLWGGEDNRDSYFKQIQKDLYDTLKEVHKEDLIVKQRGVVGILTDHIQCDYYDWIEGRASGRNAFMGEYMRQYDWAEPTWVNITAKLGNSNQWY